MVTKEEIKKEVDNLPDNLLNEVYTFLKEVTERKSKKPLTDKEVRAHWGKWRKNLKNFSSDFMNERNQPTDQQVRESFD